ncbi:MAG: hypothetical protein AAB676_09390 [Verrucomicrobiota bacterium]
MNELCLAHFLRPALASLILSLVSLRAGAEPQPGDVFSEFTFNEGAKPGTHTSELDPGIKRDFSKNFTWAKDAPRHAPHPLVLDLAGATRAELSVEFWGGHIGTSGQKFNVNSNGWFDLPQPQGTPGRPECCYRTLLGNNAVPIPLAHLRDRTNFVQFAAGPQLCYGFDFGFYWIYSFTIRVYYGADRSHAAGEIVTPRAGAAIGDGAELTVRIKQPGPGVKRVEFLAECDDFDWDGDGVWREWQYQTRYGALSHHLGTATNAPWKVTWQNQWLPDQSQPLRLVARITDQNSVTSLSPAIEGVRLARAGRSVTMHRATMVPERFTARAGKRMSCPIELPASLAGVRAARLAVSTWSGSTDRDCAHEISLNERRVANRFGRFHDYSFDLLEVPVELLKPGTNEFGIYSEFEGHGFEINWPGPVLLLERTK